MPQNSDTLWRTKARCLGVDPSVFHPSENDEVGEAAAKVICKSCEVSEACLSYAVANSEKEGVWGGQSPLERRRAHRRRYR